MKTITWILSFGLLIVIGLDSVGALDDLKHRDDPPKYAEVSFDQIAVVEDGTIYLVSLSGEVWCHQKGKSERVPGIHVAGLAKTDKLGNSLFLADIDGAYEINGCRATKLDLPQRRVNG